VLLYSYYLRRPGDSICAAVLPVQHGSVSLQILGFASLSVQKLPKAVFYSLIEDIAYWLPGWKASHIHSAGRVTLVKAVLSSIPIYLQIALHCPKWVIKAIEKIL
jgi:hypothetical protein